MVKRMLIDATHPEETRVVVLNGNKLEEFDFETSTKKQLKGNIYLAKVTRVEPSLQAAFVEYGGNRHGFLAFNEIHPDYWRIPIADREALLAEQNAQHDPDFDDTPPRSRRPRRGGDRHAAPESATAAPDMAEQSAESASPLPDTTDGGVAPAPFESGAEQAPEHVRDVHHEGSQRSFPLDHNAGLETSAAPGEPEAADETPDTDGGPEGDVAPAEAAGPDLTLITQDGGVPAEEIAAAEAPVVPADASGPETVVAEPVPIESVGGDDMDEVETRRRFKPMRHYKIQEVIKRRQVLLVQVVKEERGTKGAALTTYLSLAGRYCVLMPNTARGGGISRRITSAQDRKRLKSIIEELDLPEGMAVILRTAGMERSKPEIKRDYEYLLRQWDDIRETTLKSTAPCLVYEEGNLIKRAIRDLYSRDIEEILVEGEEGFKAARAFMKTLMPSHAGRIQLYNDPTVPLFQRFQVEAQLDEMHSPTVRLKSGGYIVINPTEALVSIDVNSGRATRERHIEETAYKTNLEAADEIARQLRLRDLAGLIVIDFIDMEDNRNQHAVERRLKEAMKSDRARIQIGRISPFGLLELSRQRLRPSLLEVSTERCPHCAGTGLVRSTESTALHVLRAIEEEGMKLRTAEAVVHVPTMVAIYILNQKRDALVGIEARYGLRVSFSRDDALIPPAYRMDRVRGRTAAEAPVAPLPAPTPVAQEEKAGMVPAPAEIEPSDEEATIDEFADAAPGEEVQGEARESGDGEHRRRRRRRRRGRGRGDDRVGAHDQHVPEHDHPRYEQVAEPEAAVAMNGAEPGAVPADMEETGGEAAYAGAPQQDQRNELGEDVQRRRRRGRRGGRRRGRRVPDGQPQVSGTDPFADPRHAEAAPDEAVQGGDMVEPAPRQEPHRPRIEGPGDAYDWPWNRRAERFPEEHGREDSEAAPQQGDVSPPPAFEQPTPMNEAPMREAPMSEAPIFARQEPGPVAEPEPARGEQVVTEPPPEPETPAGPPRKGWWRRLTR